MLKVAAKRRIADPIQPVPDNTAAKIHHRAGCPQDWKYIEKRAAPGPPSHCHASQRETVAVIRYGRHYLIGARVDRGHSPNQGAGRAVYRVAARKPHPRSYLHSGKILSLAAPSENNLRIAKNLRLYFGWNFLKQKTRQTP